DLGRTPLDDALVAQLSAAPNLRTLNLDETGVTDLAPLGVLTGLQVISARRNGLSSVEVMDGWRSLGEARFTGNPIERLDGVENLEILRLLDVSETMVSDLGPVVANEAFRRGDELIIERAALDASACSNVSVLQAREAVVTTDLACP